SARSTLPALSPCITSFFLDPATSEISTLSLHDALPICRGRPATISAMLTVKSSLRAMNSRVPSSGSTSQNGPAFTSGRSPAAARSEEHTSELQSRENLVCRLLLEKKKDCKIYYKLK